MRILLLAPHPCFQVRGTPIAERILLEALCPLGYEFDVLSFHEGEDFQIPGCRHIRIPALPGVAGVRPGPSWKKLVCDAFLTVKAVRLAASGRYDLVHAVEESVFVAVLLERLFGLPFVYDMDSSLPEQLLGRYAFLRPARRWLCALERLAVRRSLGVMVMCRALEERVLSHDARARVRRIEDVSLLVGEPRVAADLVALPGGPGPIVLYVGNLEPYQGIDLLLEGFARRSQRFGTARLVIVGGAPDRLRRYRIRAEELGIGAATHLLGPRPLEWLPGLLARADVLVSPRIGGANTPLKIYSYLDSGRAVLATRLPAHTQVLEDSIAMLVEPTAEGLASGLDRLLGDPGLRRALGAAARRRARREFRSDVRASKLRDYYAELAATLQEAGVTTRAVAVSAPTSAAEPGRV